MSKWKSWYGYGNVVETFKEGDIEHTKIVDHVEESGIAPEGVDVMAYALRQNANLRRINSTICVVYTT